MELSKSDELLRTLIKFNTVNGVNPEKPCIDYIKSLFDQAGIENSTFFLDENRPSLLAKIPVGEGVTEKYPPVLFFGHVDVVSVEGQNWSVDPFAAEVKDGYIWGRGAIDMKGEDAMFISLALELKEKNIELPFEVRFLFVSDEEGTGDFGMEFLVEKHKEIFEGIKYAFGEIGGFSVNMSGKKFYPIMIAEKQFSHIRVTALGHGGHGSFAHTDTAMEKAARAIVKLSTEKLPVRITPAVEYMVNGFGDVLGGAQKIVLKKLLNPKLTNKILKAIGKAGNVFDPLLHNNINVTLINGGSAINVIPSSVSFDCDLRLVPGCTMDDAIKDVKSIIGDGYEIEVVEYNQGSTKLDMSQMEELAKAIGKRDGEGSPIPLVLSGVTDGRFLSTLGIQTFGFTPMNMPEDYDFLSMVHDADEKIPIGATDFGREVILDYLQNGYRV
ncbi:MAG: M20/M25/M40 family metallo-hydrolase [Anaerovoracaceae bacterium]